VEHKYKVLLIEDDAGIRQSLFETLGVLGFAVGEAANGEEGLVRLRMVDYDAVLLDMNMPGMGGLETCRTINNSYPYLPVIMLTVRSDVEDIVGALDAGACDYVIKPFQVGELTARLRAAIRRQHAPIPGPAVILTIGNITLNDESRQVKRGDAEVRLSPKEYDILRFLMERAGRPVRHDILLRSVWGPLYGEEREYLRVIVNQLRKKLEDDPAHPAYILTESHIGYLFRADS
jgi:two-component system KDP operon response regulator KdpE